VGIWYENTFRAGEIEMEMPVYVAGKMEAVLNPDGSVSTVPSTGPKNVLPVSAGGGFGRGGGSLNVAQQAVAAIVSRVLTSRGVPPEVVNAAIVNAVAESGLNPNAVGDNGRSVGVFQLNERGAGAGMSVADRKDPVKNAGRIADVYFGSQGKPVRDAYAGGERRVSELAALWSANVERPADRAGEMSRRRTLAVALFPERAVAAVSDAVDNMERATWPKYAIGVAAALLAVSLAMQAKAHRAGKRAGDRRAAGAV
jgi:hypothetical protein